MSDFKTEMKRPSAYYNNHSAFPALIRFKRFVLVSIALVMQQPSRNGLQLILDSVYVQAANTVLSTFVVRSEFNDSLI